MHKKRLTGKPTVRSEKGGIILHRLFGVLIFISFIYTVFSTSVSANEALTREEILANRMDYYMKYSSVEVPWYYLAAMDQFERNIQEVRNDLEKGKNPLALIFQHTFGWAWTILF